MLNLHRRRARIAREADGATKSDSTKQWAARIVLQVNTAQCLVWQVNGRVLTALLARTLLQKVLQIQINVIHALEVLHRTFLGKRFAFRACLENMQHIVE